MNTTDVEFPCKDPDCTRTFPTAQGATMHYTRTHSESRAAYDKSKRTPAPSTNGSTPTPRRRRSDDVTADDVMTAVLDTLYPKGQVPTDLLPVLLEWRAATERLVAAARASG